MSAPYAGGMHCLRSSSFLVLVFGSGLACAQPSAAIPPTAPDDASSPDSEEQEEGEAAPSETPEPAAAAESAETVDAEVAAVSEAPEPEPEPVVRANVNMGSIEVDGMTITNLQCRIEGGGGLFGTLALFASLSQNKAEFDACAPKGAKPVVHWRFAGGRTKVIEIKDPSAKVAACVEKVMGTVAPTMEAECHATLVIGAGS